MCSVLLLLISDIICLGGQTNPEHLRQIYQAHLMLQLRVQEVGDYNQPEAIMTAARAVSSHRWPCTSMSICFTKSIFVCVAYASCQPASKYTQSCMSHCLRLSQRCCSARQHLQVQSSCRDVHELHRLCAFSSSWVVASPAVVHMLDLLASACTGCACPLQSLKSVLQCRHGSLMWRAP